MEAPDLNSYENLPAWCDPARLVFSMHLDEATPSNNVIKDLHFHEYKKLRQSLSAKVLAALSRRSPVAPVSLAGVFIARHSAGALDWDNAYGGLKPLLDCLVAPSAKNPSGLGILLDDKPANMPEPPYVRQLKAKKGQGFTEVFVFDVAR